MKFLIFGGNGFLGNFLYKNLKPTFEVYRASRKKNFGIHIKDFNSNKISEILNKVNPDVIINTIALTDVDSCQINKKKAKDSNIHSLKKIINAIKNEYKKENFPFLIHISTDQVYSGKGPHKESKPRPLNYYAKTKLNAEKIASKVNSCIIRTNFLGYSKLHENFNNRIIKNVKMNKKIYGYENIYFSPVSIDTLLKKIIFISKKKIKGVYNLGSIGGISKGKYIYKFLKENFPKFKKFYFSNYVPIKSKKKATRPLDMRLNCSKIKFRYKIKLPKTNNEVNRIIYNFKNEI